MVLIIPVKRGREEERKRGREEERKRGREEERKRGREEERRGARSHELTSDTGRTITKPGVSSAPSIHRKASWYAKRERE